jgi:hypothetical protein
MSVDDRPPPSNEEIVATMVHFSVDAASRLARDLMIDKGMTPDELERNWPKVQAALDAAAYTLAVDYTAQVEAVRGAQPSLQ